MRVLVRGGFHVHWKTRRSRARSKMRKRRSSGRKHLVCQTWHGKWEGKRKKMCSYNVTAFKRLKTVIWDMNSLNRPLVNKPVKVMQQRRLASGAALVEAPDSPLLPFSSSHPLYRPHLPHHCCRRRSLPSVSQRVAAADVASRRSCASFCGCRAGSGASRCRGLRPRSGSSSSSRSRRDLSAFCHFGPCALRPASHQRKSVQT